MYGLAFAFPNVTATAWTYAAPGAGALMGASTAGAIIFGDGKQTMDFARAPTFSAPRRRASVARSSLAQAPTVVMGRRIF